MTTPSHTVNLNSDEEQVKKAASGYATLKGAVNHSPRKNVSGSELILFRFAS